MLPAVKGLTHSPSPATGHDTSKVHRAEWVNTVNWYTSHQKCSSQPVKFNQMYYIKVCSYTQPLPSQYMTDHKLHYPVHAAIGNVYGTCECIHKEWKYQRLKHIGNKSWVEGSQSDIKLHIYQLYVYTLIYFQSLLVYFFLTRWCLHPSILFTGLQYRWMHTRAGQVRKHSHVLWTQIYL